jgi:hypothetical protein
MKRKPLAEWRAIRALVENGAAVELVAQATARSARRIEIEAEREGWRLDRVPDEDIAERVRVVSAMLLERVETLGRKALEDGEKINKNEIDGLLSIIKGLDKVAEITRSEEAVKKKQIRRDEDLREKLHHIHRGIFELAREIAAEMVAANNRPA